MFACNFGRLEFVKKLKESEQDLTDQEGNTALI